MKCKECKSKIESPTHFEEVLEVCLSCLRLNIPKIEPNIRITKALGSLKCVYCTGIIISYQEPKKIDKLTDNGTKGIVSMYHPICKERFIAEIHRRGYSPLGIKKPKKKYKQKRKKNETMPVIRNREDMLKWITRQG